MYRSVLVALLAVASACSADLTGPSAPPVNAHDVSITATVIGPVAAGDSVTLHIANSGSHTAYISRCGTGPLLLVQTFVDGSWTGGVQNFMCTLPIPSGPVEVAAGTSLDIARVFSENGRYRFIMGVATSQDLADASMATSNGFDIP